MSRSTRHQGQKRPIAVLVVVGVAVVAILTGIASMVTQPVLEAGGVLGAIQTATGFSAVLVGFVLLVAAWGMHRGYRLAYVVGLSLLVLSALHGIAQTRAVSIPLVVLSTVAIVVLIRRRRREFTRSYSLSATQIGALLALAGFVVYGTMGSYALRTDIEGVDSLLDGLYFTLVTATTVGYGDVHATTEVGRLFAITLLIFGPTTIVAVAGTLFGPVLEAHLRRFGTRATRPERVGHKSEVLLLGTADPGSRIVGPLAENSSLTVVTPDEDWARELEATAVHVHVGDPADTSVLENALDGEQAAIVVAVEAETTPYATLAARRVDADARIVTVATGGHEADLTELGADVTIDPAFLLARTTASAALGWDAESLWGGRPQ